MKRRLPLDELLAVGTDRHAPDQVFKPVFFRVGNLDDEQDLIDLLTEKPRTSIYDTMEDQLVELIRVLYPDRKLDRSEQLAMVNAHLAGVPMRYYGVWVYYPWLEKLVHLLDEEEYIRVRTNRNIYKILPDEITALRRKSIGIIGLSVGQAIATTLAMERICGEVRLADFDHIELGNMNRIKDGVHNLGLNKTIAAARQIAEVDPFIDVKCFPEGTGVDTMDEFLTAGGKIDVLVEECDGIAIKIWSRIRAKALGIPVVMDTNDKGMLDVERFDLDPNQPILYGRVADLEELPQDKLVQKLGALTAEEKVEYLAQMIGWENISAAMKQSLGEMGKSITGWPQLASSVVLGGAMVTDACRKILIGKPLASGRRFIDFEELIS